jgi:hypothetical protein
VTHFIAWVLFCKVLYYWSVHGTTCHEGLLL